MLDLGIWEIVTIAVVAILVLKPEDIPEMLYTAGRWFGKIRALGHELSEALDSATRDAGLHEVTRNMTTVIDLEGKAQPAYDVKELEKLKGKD